MPQHFTFGDKAKNDLGRITERDESDFAKQVELALTNALSSVLVDFSDSSEAPNLPNKKRRKQKAN